MNGTRVVRIITRLNVGGPAYQAVILNYLLQERFGYRTLLVFGRTERDEPFFERLLKEYPVDVYFCPHLSREIDFVNDYRAYLDIKNVLKNYKPQIVHTHTAKAGFIGRLAAKKLGIPIIVHTFHGHTFYGYFNWWKRTLIMEIERRVARFTSRIIAISNSQKEEFVNLYRIAPSDKIRVIELGLPLERYLKLPARGKFRRKLGIPNEAVVLGSLGRLVPIKNYKLLIEVFASLIDELPGVDIRLIIAGEGYLKSDLISLANSLGIAGKVYFPGVIYDLPQFYSDVDICVLTSINEGTPVFLIESASAGVPIVAPDVGGVRDILYCPPHKLIKSNVLAEYVDTIKDIIRNLQKYKEWSNNIELRKKVVKRFHIDRLVGEVNQLYTELLGKEGR